MKTVEVRFTPSEESEHGVAEGIIAITGTDKKVQAMLKKVNEVKDDVITDMFVVGEFVRVNEENVQEYSAIYDAKDGAVTVEDLGGKMVDVPMTSVQNLGERRVLSLVGGFVQKDIEVGDLVVLSDGLTYICNKTVTTYPFTSVKGNCEEHSILIARFENGDDVVTADGLRKLVQKYEADGTVTMSDGTFADESELEPWDMVTAVQRYAASFGMKVTVDVS